ncbi:MAG: VOC family protein [Cellvibrionaceae bacterium]
MKILMVKRLKAIMAIVTVALCSVILIGCSQENKEITTETLQQDVDKLAEDIKGMEDKLEETATSVEKQIPQTAHVIGAAKLIVDDLVETQKFYETMFGMKEVRRYDYDLDTFEETIMGFESGGATLALFAPNDKVEVPLKKPAAPLVLIYTPEFEAVTKRIKEANYPVRVFMTKETGPFNIAIARDPSGNAVEIFGRDNNQYAVGGSKLMVDDRVAAEEFYKDILDATPRDYYKTSTYDEVIVVYGDGPFHALYQPLNEAPLPKSRFPQTAIYTTDFDGVLAKIEKRGLGYREVKTQTEGLRIIIAKDTAGNAIEIISR